MNRINSHIFYFFLILILLINIPNVFANKKDSLLTVIKSHKTEDTNQVINIRALTYHYLIEEGDVDNAIKSAERAIELAKKINSIKWLAKMNSLLGYLKQNYTSDYEGAIKAHYLALDYFDKENNELEKYAVYLNLGIMYYNYKQFEDSEKCLKKAEKIALKTKVDIDLATAYFNLGSLYDIIRKDELAVMYYEKSRKLYEKLGSEIDIATIDFNITNNKLNRTNEQIDRTTRIKAISVYKRVKNIFKENEAEEYYIPSIIALGSQLTEIGELNEGTKYLLEAEELATKNQNLNILLDVYFRLADNFNKRKDFISEANYLRKHTYIKDSLFVQNKSKAIAEVQVKYETEKLGTENEVLTQQTKIKDLEISKRDIEITQSKTIRYILIFGVLMLVIFGAFTYKRYKVSQVQKQIIEKQKLTVEEKQKEITDSINYAKRIQEAILPTADELNKNLKNGFVLYLPKDIVAGDFYWMECLPAVYSSQSSASSRLKTEDCGLILFAAADCTGHGVPGAMVSVVCNGALNRAVGEYKLTQPAEILNKVQELVVETFDKGSDDYAVRDGMDISLCSFNLSESSELSEKYTIQWAGANNPLWIIRSLRHCGLDPQSDHEITGQARNDEHKIIEIKPDKQPIGKYLTNKPFTNHEIEVMKGDRLYLFTDGFADQFGGESGKKLKYKQFKQLLLSVQHLTMDEQKNALQDFFFNWKGSLEQIDDVCVIGVEIV